MFQEAAIAAVVESLDPSTFADAALGLATVDGQVAAVPSDGWGQLIVYRKDLFDAAGLEAPTTYEAIEAAAAAVGDRRNMVFSGTVATHGRGRAVVTATGQATEFGAIGRLLAGVEKRRTPLQNNLDRLGRVLASAALAVVVLIVAAGMVSMALRLGVERRLAIAALRTVIECRWWSIA